MRRNLIVLGSSGLAREMAMVAEQLNARFHTWNFLGFIAGDASEASRDLGMGKVLGDDAWLLDSDLQADLIIGVGYPKVRAKILAKYLNLGSRFSFPNLVHPSATLDFRRVELGQGNVITAGAAFTCDIEVGDFNLFNLNTTVGHDARIGDYNVFNPSVNISGGVRVGSQVLAGTGCQILENLQIGDDAILGAGSVVVKNVEPGLTVVGIPAKPLPSR
jgi:sugar O-acyltransferase (sialic acid O-acetyltransferase NeuD family)